MSLNTAALGLQTPWRVERAELSTAKWRIDFDVVCTGQRMTCSHCGVVGQGIHERVRRSWRHLDFFQLQGCAAATAPGGHLLRPFPRGRAGRQGHGRGAQHGVQEPAHGGGSGVG
jgi:hypothetical protein